MRRKTGDLLMILGGVLVLLALALFLYNRWDADRAGRASEEILTILEDTEDTIAKNASDDVEYWEDEVSEEVPAMKTVEVDGWTYIGSIEIPSISRKLPVMANWSYAGLKKAPGRYSGSVYTNDLVIAGHNYRSHFSPIKWLSPGSEVIFTDVTGDIYRYEVTEVETIAATDIEGMTTHAADSDWDLTLFTCTQGGQARCAVRCMKVNGEESQNVTKN